MIVEAVIVMAATDMAATDMAATDMAATDMAATDTVATETEATLVTEIAVTETEEVTDMEIEIAIVATDVTTETEDTEVDSLVPQMTTTNGEEPSPKFQDAIQETKSDETHHEMLHESGQNCNYQKDLLMEVKKERTKEILILFFFRNRSETGEFGT